MTEDRALELALASLHQGRRLARTNANIAEYTAAIKALEALREERQQDRDVTRGINIPVDQLPS